MEYTKEALKTVMEPILEADSIILFGHVNPDGDCLGSTLGMRHALKELFPNKKVYAVGSHPAYLEKLLEPSDVLTEDIYRSSLALIVDVSSPNRIEDKNYELCPKKVCFDHHIASDEVSFPVFRDEEAPSCTYVLAKSLKTWFGKIPSSAAYYLFLGLVTDTGRFQYDSKPETFALAAELVSYGVDYRDVYNKLYVQTSKGIKFRSYVYSHFIQDGNVSYVLVPKEAYQSLGIEANEASSQVNLLAGIDGKPLWAEFAEQPDGSIRVELRGNGHYNVQKAAIAFGGGGHFSASGCRLDSFDKAKEVVAFLNGLKAE